MRLYIINFLIRCNDQFQLDLSLYLIIAAVLTVCGGGRLSKQSSARSSIVFSPCLTWRLFPRLEWYVRNTPYTTSLLSTTTNIYLLELQLHLAKQTHNAAADHYSSSSIGQVSVKRAQQTTGSRGRKGEGGRGKVRVDSQVIELYRQCTCLPNISAFLYPCRRVWVSWCGAIPIK